MPAIFETAQKAARVAYAKEFAACKTAGMNDADSHDWASDYAADVQDSTLDSYFAMQRASAEAAKAAGYVAQSVPADPLS